MTAIVHKLNCKSCIFFFFLGGQKHLFFLPFCCVFVFVSVPAFTYFYHQSYLCHSARRLSNADCFSAAFPTNSLCCLWRSATSSSSWLLSASLFKAELSAASPGFSCSALWQTSWSKQKCCLYWSDTQDKNSFYSQCAPVGLCKYLTMKSNI